MARSAAYLKAKQKVRGERRVLDKRMAFIARAMGDTGPQTRPRARAADTAPRSNYRKNSASASMRAQANKNAAAKAAKTRAKHAAPKTALKRGTKAKGGSGGGGG